MRLSSVPLACVACALVQLCLTAPAQAYGCCDPFDETRTTVFDDAESTIFDETKSEYATAPVLDALRPAPTPLDAAERLADKKSYADVFSVLKNDNTCSRFFGGPSRAVTVLNQFARQLRRRPLGAEASAIAVRMSGSYMKYQDALTGASYRLFKEATINSNGPFAARVNVPWSSRMQIGRFPVETRQARALVLLHELGHLIEGADGRWLLPDDGYDAALSERNTRTVEAVCAKQLLALGD
jgi:hypothetical protein